MERNPQLGSRPWTYQNQILKEHKDLLISVADFKVQALDLSKSDFKRTQRPPSGRQDNDTRHPHHHPRCPQSNLQNLQVY